jgi:hypothetical protein
MSLALYPSSVRSSEVSNGMLLDPMSRFFKNPRTIVYTNVVHSAIATCKRIASATRPHLGIPPFGANQEDGITQVFFVHDANHVAGSARMPARFCNRPSIVRSALDSIASPPMMPRKSRPS